MKKLSLILLGLCVPFIMLFCGCTKYDYSPYYNITSKGGGGPNIYAWQIDDGGWRCAAFMGLNRGISKEELAHFQNELPCPLKEMKKILKTYSSEERESTIIYVVGYLQNASESDITYYLQEDAPETYAYLYTELGLSVR